MKKTKYILLLCLTILISACQKDLMEDVENEDWNYERNILQIDFEGQVGKSKITRDGNYSTVEFTYNVSTSTLDKVKVKQIAVSHNASINIKDGDLLNFLDGKDVEVLVTPKHGDPLKWKIKLIPFEESLIGKWNIEGLTLWGGTGPEYGGGELFELSVKGGSWNATDGPKAELDNEVTFELGNITPEGNTSGKIINNSGADGKYADFIFVGASPSIDVNDRYRVLPKGEGTWSRNYENNTLTIKFADGTTKVGAIRNTGDKAYSYWLEREIKTPAIEFELSGQDDWDAIFTDFDRIVKRPRVLWVDMKKK